MSEGHDHWYIVSNDEAIGWGITPEDAFIAAARADVPSLVAEVRRLRDAVERVRALVADADTWTPYDSRDTGKTFLAESVRDLLADIRAALDGAP